MFHAKINDGINYGEKQQMKGYIKIEDNNEYEVYAKINFYVEDDIMVNNICPYCMKKLNLIKDEEKFKKEMIELEKRWNNIQYKLREVINKI